MNQPTPNHPTPPNASFHAPKFEIRYATYAALEKLKSEIWMEFDHEKPTVVVCVWDGAGAVDSINVFTSFESAIDERGADIRVVLREIDGTDLEDQPAIILFLPTHEYIVRYEATQGTETSKYLQEEKERSIFQVAASERERGQTVSLLTGLRISDTVKDHFSGRRLESRDREGKIPVREKMIKPH